MTRVRLNYLFLAIAIFLACGLIVSLVARAEEKPPPAWTLGGYGIMDLSGAMGYEQPAFGLQGEGSARWKFLEMWGNARIFNQKKKNAESGYTYGWGLQGRGYVYGPWYVSGSYIYGGYHTEFDSGTVWEKSGALYGVGAGYNNYDTDIGLTYFFREYGSPNSIQTTKLNYHQRVYKNMWLLFEVEYSTWDQGAERWNGFCETVGIGMRW